MGTLLQELQLEIVDMLGCAKTCPGCALSIEDRQATKSSLSKNNLDKIYEKIIEYISTHNLKKFNLIYGSGDHGILTEKYLIDLYEKGAGLIIDKELANGKNSIAMTFTLVQPHKALVPIFNSLQQAVAKTEIFGTVPFEPIIMFDLSWLIEKQFPSDYMENLKLTVGTFNKIDLSVNLCQSSIEKIKPKELFLFAKDHGFNEVIINLFPSIENCEETLLNNKKMLKWVLDYDELLNKYHQPPSPFRSHLKASVQQFLAYKEKLQLHNKDINKDVSYDGENAEFIKIINQFAPKIDELKEVTLSQYLDAVYNQTVRNNIQVDHHGEVFQKFIAVGNTIHHPRTGFNSLGNILGTQSLSDIIHKSSKKIKKTILDNMDYPGCNKCLFQKACVTTGFHVFNHIIFEKIKQKKIKPGVHSAKLNTQQELGVKENIQPAQCLHLAQGLFEHYQEQILAEWQKLEV